MRIIKADVRGIKTLIDLSKGYFLTTIINNALPFLLLPIMTRYLTTGEYGMLSLFSFYMVMAFSLIGASLPVVVSKYFYEKDKGYIAEITGNCVHFSFVLLMITESVIVIIYPFLHQYLSIPLLWMMAIPIGAFAQVIFSLGLTICRNRKKVSHFGCHQIANTAINVLISLIFVCLFLWGWHGRALGMLLSFVFSAIAMMVYLSHEGYLDLHYSKNSIREVKNVVLPLIPNSIQLNIISQVGLFFMQLYFTKELLGLYSLGFQIAFCMKLFVDTIAMSWGPFLYQQLSLNGGMNKLYVTRLLWVLIIVLFLGAAAIILIAKPVLWLMTTPNYYSAVQFVPWFILGMFFYGVYILMNPFLIKNNQQSYIGKVSFLSMVVMIVSNICFSKQFGYMGIVYAYCVSYVFMSLILIIRVQRMASLPWIVALKIWKSR